MKLSQFLLFPLNVLFIMLLGLVLALFKFSDFYETPDSWNIVIYIMSLTPLMIYYQFYIRRKNFYIAIDENIKLSKLYKLFLTLSVGFFSLSFFKVGIPIFSPSGRDIDTILIDDKFASICNILAYSLMIAAVTFAATFSSKKSILLCFCLSVLFSILLLSRQLAMVSFVIVLITYFCKNTLNISKVIYILSLMVFIGFFFSFLGNYRQQIHGDYVADYAHLIGNSTREGFILNDTLYWLWLYIASPIYNLFYNLDVFKYVNSPCFNVDFECVGSFLSSEVLPLTISKALNLTLIEEKLVVGHLNVSTAYAKAVVIFGSYGIFLHVILQIIFFQFINLFCHPSMKFVLRIYYSAIIFFSIFSNLFIAPHFFFVMIIILIVGWLNSGRINNLRRNKESRLVK
ncbi:oligosaccharide repeat unit polymerase [Escherichia coli]|uniref:O-antigen polymerase n=1 Tax=Escherichia coli TaxID=562 RepID=UPI000E1E18A2|nr:O-antigen polymerase [Escherichia coli]EID0495873.1 oligosaccharide repeat unit polymerase [Escherichia coli]ELR0752517.1 oligosaccharide repeat unit polymerase [Escherichia coli]RDQ24974.1 hypothetical protein C4A35_03033 [Escherichia coli]HBA8985937.1 oligosaccharide repeat unit polymerase [Escherichia coli]HBA9053835.1 oligosaccharide repeat unit polymerase [Escherichia coli]